MADTNINSSKVQETKKGAPIGMIALSIILTAALVFLVVMYIDQKNKMVEMKTALTQEKDSLVNELTKMAYAYDTLKTDNDSLNAGIERQKQRIVKLLSINASDIQLIKKYKSEISTMREIMKSYIVQIDSLNSRNKILIAENTQIKQQITEVQNVNTELEKVKEELNAKVEVASVIQAKNISAVAVNKKNKETSRLNLMEKLRVGFTLRENPIAKAGPKEIYMRVIRPDSLVIATSPDNLFEYNGNKMIYSAARTIDYMNQDIDVTIWLDNTGDFVPGNYSAEVYLENVIIGKTTFLLTKR
jgi:archaellum component FlaF (FlaF/FlaG flagellin family)